MSNETYIDFDRKHFKRKLQHEDVKYLDATHQIDIIKELVHQFPNDMDLGTKVREFINLQYIK